MKIYRNIAVFAVIAIISALSLANAQEEAKTKIITAEIKTSAQCEQCKERIEKAVKKLDGVEFAELNVETKILTVKFEEEDINLEKIKKTVNKTGYDADDMPADKRAYAKLPKCCQKGGHD